MSKGFTEKQQGLITPEGKKIIKADLYDCQSIVTNAKCKILRISRSFNPVIHLYQMRNILIGPVDSYVISDLQTVTKDLSWKVHIDSITKKANCSVGFIMHSCGFKDPMQASKTTKSYCTLCFNGT